MLSASPPSPYDGRLSSKLSGKAAARLSVDLQDVQDAASLQSRLLTGVTDMFEELVTEEHRRRQSWEDKVERSLREVRAGVEADLAKTACEARRLAGEARREASESRSLVQPCFEFIAPFQRQEVPELLANYVMNAIRAEVQATSASESERLTQQLQQRLADGLLASSRDQSEQIMRALAEESTKWADACAQEMAEVVAREAKVRDSLRTNVEGRLTHIEKQLAGEHGELVEHEKTITGRLAKMEAKIAGEHGIMVRHEKVEKQLQEGLEALQEAHLTLQAGIERYAERWQQAWREEAKLRATGIAECQQKYDVQREQLANGILEFQQKFDVFESYAERWQQAWREEAELRASGILDCQQKYDVLMRACEMRASQVDTSFRNLDVEEQRRSGEVNLVVSALRKEVEDEMRNRQESDTQLSNGVVELQNRVLDIQTELRNMQFVELQSQMIEMQTELHNLQQERRVESEVRNITDSQITANVERLRSSVAQVQIISAANESRLANNENRINESRRETNELSASLRSLPPMESQESPLGPQPVHCVMESLQAIQEFSPQEVIQSNGGGKQAVEVSRPSSIIKVRRAVTPTPTRPATTLLQVAPSAPVLPMPPQARQQRTGHSPSWRAVGPALVASPMSSGGGILSHRGLGTPGTPLAEPLVSVTSVVSQFSEETGSEFQRSVQSAGSICSGG